MLSEEQKDQERYRDKMYYEMHHPSAMPSRDRQTTNARISKIINEGMAGPSALSKIMKTTAKIIFAILFISIVLVIGFGTILYPFYALPAALAPALSAQNKYILVLGIPLFWAISFILTIHLRIER